MAAEQEAPHDRSDESAWRDLAESWLDVYKPESGNSSEFSIHLHARSLARLKNDCARDDAARTVRALHLVRVHIYFTSNGSLAADCSPGEIELYQSMFLVKYITAATARKLAIAPTSRALSSSRKSV